MDHQMGGDFVRELERSWNGSIRSDTAKYHINLCVEQIEKFILRPGLGK
jgi:hypothetical protein